MSLEVELGDGANPAANSYVSLAEAEAYIESLPPFSRTGWTALLTQDEKEKLLIYATRVLEQRASFSGTKTLSSNPLRWPRMNVFDCDDLPVAPDVVPAGIKAACIELAVFYATPGRAPSAIAENEGLTRLVVDVLEFEWKEAHKASEALRFPYGINALLCGLGKLATGRAKFVPIKKV